MAMSWREKYLSRPKAVVEITDKKFADIPTGTTVVISTPTEVDEVVRKIPFGQQMTTTQIRDIIAKKHNVSKTCPITTGIFLRIASEVAIEEIQEGKSIDKVMPFWRVVEPKSVIGKKLACGPEFITHMRLSEGLPV